MKSTHRSTNAPIIRRAVTALLAGALVLSCMLVGGGPVADSASKRPSKRSVFVWSSHKPGGGATGQATAGFLLKGEQNGRMSRRGARPLGIIAILIGLKADQDYALRFSTARCGSGQGGGIFNYLVDRASLKRTLIGRGIKFTSASDGTAYVEQDSLWTRKANRRAKSVLLLEGDPDRPLVVCGRIRVAAGDVNGDGIPNA